MSAPRRRAREAVALRYDAPESEAPRITAAGSGAVAERILELARRHGVPVREDRALVEILAKLEVGSEIPPQLYQVVAEVLAYVYRVNARLGPTDSDGVDGSSTRADR